MGTGGQWCFFFGGSDCYQLCRQKTFLPIWAEVWLRECHRNYSFSFGEKKKNPNLGKARLLVLHLARQKWKPKSIQQLFTQLSIYYFQLQQQLGWFSATGDSANNTTTCKYAYTKWWRMERVRIPGNRTRCQVHCPPSNLYRVQAWYAVPYVPSLGTDSPPQHTTWFTTTFVWPNPHRTRDATRAQIQTFFL